MKLIKSFGRRSFLKMASLATAVTATSCMGKTRSSTRSPY